MYFNNKFFGKDKKHFNYQDKNMKNLFIYCGIHR